MNDLEKEFLASMKALMTRYGVKIEKGLTGFDEEVEEVLLLTNDEMVVGEKAIYLNLNDYMFYLNGGG
jgi:Flp pilus assembly CpaF family ATPase